MWVCIYTDKCLIISSPNLSNTLSTHNTHCANTTVFMQECGKYFKHPALIIVDHVLEPVHHLSVWTPVNMASHPCTDRSFSYSKYYLELKGDAKKRYNYKLKIEVDKFQRRPILSSGEPCSIFNCAYSVAWMASFDAC